MQWPDPNVKKEHGSPNVTPVSRGHPSIPPKKKKQYRARSRRTAGFGTLARLAARPAPLRGAALASVQAGCAAARTPVAAPAAVVRDSGEERAPPRSGLGPITGVSAVPLAPMARLMDGESGRPIRRVVTERRTRLGLRRTCSGRPCCPGPRQRRRCPPAAVRQVLPGREPPGRSPSLLLRPSLAWASAAKPATPGTREKCAAHSLDLPRGHAAASPPLVRLFGHEGMG